MDLHSWEGEFMNAAQQLLKSPVCSGREQSPPWTWADETFLSWCCPFFLKGCRKGIHGWLALERYTTQLPLHRNLFFFFFVFLGFSNSFVFQNSTSKCISIQNVKCLGNTVCSPRNWHFLVQLHDSLSWTVISLQVQSYTAVRLT